MADHIEKSTEELVQDLNDYCMYNKHPKPTMKSLEHVSSIHELRYSAICTVGLLRRICYADERKEACKLAITQMIDELMKKDYEEMKKKKSNLPSLSPTLQSQSRESIFGEYIRTRNTINNDVILKFPNSTEVLNTEYQENIEKLSPEIKAAGLEILNNTNYTNYEDQAMDLLSALQITPKIIKSAAVHNKEPMVYIELDIDLDAVFTGLASNVYVEILKYFTEVLKQRPKPEERTENYSDTLFKERDYPY